MRRSEGLFVLGVEKVQCLNKSECEPIQGDKEWQVGCKKGFLEISRATIAPGNVSVVKF